MHAILIVFFVSGCVSLIYEVVWMRYLTLIFGVTVFATSTILATFMGGLALGSFLFGRWADRLRRPLLGYAALEAAIGIYALIVPSLFVGLRTPYVALYQLDLPYTGLALSRALLAGFALLPPTVLMGGTLPVLAAYFVRQRGDVGRQTGLLYFVNTGGAVAGCALGGFYLLEHVGMVAATQIAAAANFGLAITTVLLDRWQRPVEKGAAGPVTTPEGIRPISPAVARAALWAIAISGFASLAYEVFWTRALLRYVYNSTYAFTTMLSVFLLGLAIGSWLHNTLPWRRKRPAFVFAVLELGAGLGFLVSLLLFVDLRKWSSLLLGETLHSFGDSLVMFVVRSALILLLPTIFLGAAVPLATHMVAGRRAAVGRSVGHVYAVNTVGAILGSLAVSFLLIPALGMQNTLLLLVSINVALAAALAAAEFEALGQRLAAGGAGVAVLVAIALLMPSDVFRRTFVGSRGGELLFYREGATDTVGVVEQRGQRRISYEDQRGTAGTWSYPVGYIFGHMPVLLHPGHPKKGLHICFGVGNSLSAMAAHESIERVDNVELSPHVAEAAKYFWTNNGIIDDPKVHTIIDDGRNFVMASDETYDVIALEPPETYTAGVINLYTREFYEDVEKRLAEDGVVVQWIPVGEGTLDEEKMLFRSFSDVFPHATVWQQLTRNGNIMLVGSKQPLRIDYQLLQRKMNERRVRRDLELSKVNDPVDVLSMFIFGPERYAEFVRDVPPVVDDKTVLDFSIPRRIGSGFGTGFFLGNANDGSVTPLGAIAQRTRYYYSARGSPLPHLTNLGDVDPRELDLEILRRQRPSNAEVLIPIAESDWNRWPEYTQEG